MKIPAWLQTAVMWLVRKLAEDFIEGIKEKAAKEARESENRTNGALLLTYLTNTPWTNASDFASAVTKAAKQLAAGRQLNLMELPGWPRHREKYNIQPPPMRTAAPAQVVESSCRFGR